MQIVALQTWIRPFPTENFTLRYTTAVNLYQFRIHIRRLLTRSKLIRSTKTAEKRFISGGIYVRRSGKYMRKCIRNLVRDSVRLVVGTVVALCLPSDS